MKLILMICICVTAAVPIAAGGMDALGDFQGIRYTEVGRPVGMPMGGIGAGTIEVTSQGTLAEFRNINNWAARIPSIPGSALWLTYTTGGSTRVFPLAGGKVRFEGNFPFAKLEFPDLPVKVTLWCWSPLVLHDIRQSSYPIAIFDARLTNTGNARADAGLVLSYGTDYADWLQRLATANAEPVQVAISSASRAHSGERTAGISFSTRARVDQSALQARTEKLRQELEAAYLRSYDLTPIDISRSCNRSYLRSPFGADPGNAPLNFGDLKPGKLSIYGVPFQIVDDAASDGKSCVMAGPWQPKATISVGAKADCLFFFGNCAGWANTAAAGTQYTVRYTDGTQKVVALRNGYEMTDWMGGSADYSPAQFVGKSATGGAYAINLFAIVTDPSREIESVELAQAGGAAPIVFAITAGTLSKMPMADGIVASRRVDVTRMAGSVGSLRHASNTDAQYALAARLRPGASVFTYAVAKHDGLAAAIQGARQAEPGATVYAVEQRVSLKPGKSAELGLLCGWFAPNHTDVTGKRFGHKYEEWFADAGAVVEEVARDHDKLLSLTKKHYDIIAKTTLPKWYREMVQSNFYLMPAGTWYTKDGIAFTYETPDGCPLFGTMDVRYYGSFTKLAGFPLIDQIVLRQFAQVQHPDGFIQHDLGGSIGLMDTFAWPQDSPPAPTAPKANRHDYDGYWVNLPIKFCLEVARNYQWTGDRTFLSEMWPHIKRAIVWIRAQDEDNCGLPETNYGYDGWKMIDKSNYDANQWIAMLVAVARLADDLGEPAYATELRGVHRRALAQIRRHLWTGRYFRQAYQNETGNNDMVSILQCAGDWYADILGFDDGLPREQVRSALQAIDDVNGKDAMYGATDCLYPDGSRSQSWICNGQAIGWQYFYASHCMYEEMNDIALRVAHETWQQFTVDRARLPWCQEEFIADPPKGECPYWLTRDMRMGATMVMAYAAAGLRMDVPKGTMSVRPAEWVWKDARFVLPAIMPRLMGQISCAREAGEETYQITNLEKPLALKSLLLRTRARDNVAVTVAGKTQRRKVSPDGAVDVGPVTLGAKTVVRIEHR